MRFTYMSGLSALSPSHTKAICEPSGEKLGERSDPGYVVTGISCKISGAGDELGDEPGSGSDPKRAYGHTAATLSPNIAPAGNVMNHGHTRLALIGISFDGSPTADGAGESRSAIARSSVMRASPIACSRLRGSFVRQRAISVRIDNGVNEGNRWRSG